MNEKEVYGVIFITKNMINGKGYTGQSTKVEDVINGRYKGSGTYLWNAIEKYGWDAFKSEIIDVIYYKDNLEEKELQIELNDKEEYWVDENKTLVEHGGYNLKKGGNQGGKCGEELKRKMSESRTGKYAGELNGMYGKSHCEEVRLLLSNLAKNKTGSKNPRYGKKTFCAKDINGNIFWIESNDIRYVNGELAGINSGVKFSEETNKKKAMKRERNGMYGVSLSGELNGMYGKEHSTETRSKISDSLNNLPKVKCIYCVAERAEYVIKRYHNEKCKFKVNV